MYDPPVMKELVVRLTSVAIIAAFTHVLFKEMNDKFKRLTNNRIRENTEILEIIEKIRKKLENEIIETQDNLLELHEKVNDVNSGFILIN